MPRCSNIAVNPEALGQSGVRRVFVPTVRLMIRSHDFPTMPGPRRSTSNLEFRHLRDRANRDWSGNFRLLRRLRVSIAGGGQGITYGLYPRTLRQLARAHDAGWSSPVARQAHNLKVTGSNPVPATIEKAR